MIEYRARQSAKDWIDECARNVRIAGSAAPSSLVGPIALVSLVAVSRKSPSLSLSLFAVSLFRLLTPVRLQTLNYTDDIPADVLESAKAQPGKTLVFYLGPEPSYALLPVRTCFCLSTLSRLRLSLALASLCACLWTFELTRFVCLCCVCNGAARDALAVSPQEHDILPFAEFEERIKADQVRRSCVCVCAKANQ